MIKKILFIRRDNIGDLVCTTPAIHAVRQKYPDAKIGILVNSYNADAIINNPDIDKIYIYEKAKHVPDKNKLKIYINNLNVLFRIRKEKYDVAIACGSYSPRLTRYTYLTGAVVRIGYLPKCVEKSISYNIALHEPEEPMHEVERVFNLLSPLGIDGKPDNLRIFPDRKEIKKVQNCLKSFNLENNKPVIAFHISSRKPENRWSSEKFSKLAELAIKYLNASILLLWSPGSEKNPKHPGDDEKAEAIVKSLPQIIPYKTIQLKELIAALTVADCVICLDGGAMHIAAALGKPIVTIWGSTNPDRWRPWGVKHIIFQDETKKAENIDIGSVYNVVETLLSSSQR